ncbi:MAG: purine-nucleoside phosphorylase [Candidatus Cloacimonadaceae bacterium]|jgi:purine-nucleoside phosphorylase|nr:purine-nucleoside phosphorylase [Candidatus Cloacimonadota bacterium]
MNYRDTAEWLTHKLTERPLLAVILGTGLSDMAETFEIIQTIPYDEIPGFVMSTAPSHKGNLILARSEGKTILLLQGRFHYYEGYSMPQVVFPTRVVAAMGLKTLVVTNAAGSLRKSLSPGSIVQITDHINCMGTNPLIGKNDDKLGERFPSMNDLYDPDYRRLCDEIAASHDIETHKGVYVAVCGPSLETKAECAAFAGMGADLVGMSTVPEVLAARHAGMRVIAYSIVTNYSNLFHSEAHSQEEIRQNAAVASQNLKQIISCFIASL